MRLFYILIIVLSISTFGFCADKSTTSPKKEIKTLSFKIYKDSCPADKKLITDCYWIKWDDEKKPWFRGLPVASNGQEDGEPLQINIISELLKKYGVNTEGKKLNRLKHSYYVDLFNKNENELRDLLFLKKEAQIKIDTCENINDCRNVKIDILPNMQAIKKSYIKPEKKQVAKPTPAKIPANTVKIEYSDEIMTEFKILKEEVSGLAIQHDTLNRDFVSNHELEGKLSKLKDNIVNSFKKPKNDSAISLIENGTIIFLVIIGVLFLASIFISFVILKTHIKPYQDNIDDIVNNIKSMYREIEEVKHTHRNYGNKLDSLLSNTQKDLDIVNTKLMDFSKRQDSDSRNISNKLHLFEKDFNIGKQFFDILERHTSKNYESTTQNDNTPINSNTINVSDFYISYDKKLIVSRALMMKNTLSQYSDLISQANNSNNEDVRLFTQKYLLNLFNKDIVPMDFEKFFSSFSKSSADMSSSFKKGGEFDGLLNIYNLVHAGQIFKMYLSKNDIVCVEFLAAQALIEEYAHVFKIALSLSNVNIQNVDYGLVTDNNYLNTKSIPLLLETFFHNNPRLAKDIFYNSFDEIDKKNDFIVYWVDFRFSSSEKLIQRGTVTKLSALKIMRGDSNVNV